MRLSSSLMSEGTLEPTVGILWSATAMVRSGRRSLRPAISKTLERLRAGDLVKKVAVDIENAGAVGEFLDDVAVPDLIEKGAWPAGGHVCSRAVCGRSR